ISRETAVPIPRLEQWRAQALAGMERALQAHKASDPAQHKLDEVRHELGRVIELPFVPDDVFELGAGPVVCLYVLRRPFGAYSSSSPEMTARHYSDVSALGLSSQVVRFE